jgi:hypothetical protein
MLRYAADENFNNDILRGLRRRDAEVDVVRVQDAELSGALDPIVLEWAAREDRIVLSHDVSTMVRFAYDRVRAGQPMPGLFEVSRRIPLGQAIEDLLLLTRCSRDGEWQGQVLYLPLRSEGPPSL